MDVKQRGGKFLTSNERTKHAWHNEFGWLPAKAKIVYGLSSKILFKHKWGIPKVTVLVHFWQGQIYPLKAEAHKILLKVKTFQETTSSLRTSGISN